MGSRNYDVIAINVHKIVSKLSEVSDGAGAKNIISRWIPYHHMCSISSAGEISLHSQPKGPAQNTIVTACDIAYEDRRRPGLNSYRVWVLKGSVQMSSITVPMKYA
jgi:hypothetical protein